MRVRGRVFSPPPRYTGATLCGGLLAATKDALADNCKCWRQWSGLKDCYDTSSAYDAYLADLSKAGTDYTAMNTAIDTIAADRVFKGSSTVLNQCGSSNGARSLLPPSMMMAVVTVTAALVAGALLR
jgi:hypothetical protein